MSSVLDDEENEITQIDTQELILYELRVISALLAELADADADELRESLNDH